MGRPRTHGDRVQIKARVAPELVQRIVDELAQPKSQPSQNDLVVAALEDYLTRAEARRRPRTPITRDWRKD